MLKKTSLFLVSMIMLKTIVAQDVKEISAVMNKVKLTFTLDEKGTPVYAVSFDNKEVIKPSSLGFKLSDGSSLSSDFELTGTEKKKVNETWKPVLGEVSTIRNNYEQLIVHLKQKGTNKFLDIAFRVFADGVGFRYQFPKQPSIKYFIVTDELTQFNLAGNHKCFWIPGDYDTNEYTYVTSTISEVDNKPVVDRSTEIVSRVAPDRYAVQTPFMMKSQDGLYINIHEAALINYPAMQLHVDNSTYKLSSNLVPDAFGNKAYLHAPFNTPWRTIIVSDKATDLLSSKMILNLNEPSKIANTSWIKPTKFVGVWWEMHVGKGTWNYSDFADSVDSKGKMIPNGKHSANTANVKRYIDFAAKNGIKGVLVEGWNTGWDDWFGNWKENVFDFVTPYPDYDAKGLMAYAKSKKVELIMHNETSGSATNYDRQMDTAFRYMKKLGYNAVKTGYVGRIIPRGEYHDGQWMINHYLRVLDKGVQYKVMIDAHEPVRPTGLHRTYPNFLACEAARGNEFNAWSIGNPPEHETILPFTRLMGGPMDYTPGIFNIRMNQYVPDRKTEQIHTTLAKQLALYVTIYSPVQMAADLPENYEAKMDAFQFIKDVAVDWDDTKIVEAEPGDYITIARKGKGTANWFVGAITDENGREAAIPLSFLDKAKKYVAIIYKDADNADWKANPEAYVIEKYIVDNTTTLNIKLAPGGGTAISIKPATGTDVNSVKAYTK